MLAEARRDAEANGQKIIDQAKAEAVAQRERAVAEIENAKKVAMADIAAQTSGMAMQVARGVIGRELSADDHADLIAQAMQRLPSQN
jgi:F-type H+-transporting ATPase subunit b